MIARFILSFLGLFLIEIWLMVVVGSRIGGLATVVLIFLGMVVGAGLIRHRGRALSAQLRQGTVPGSDLLWMPLAGFLFLFPGFFSDLLGVLILLPPVQNLLLNWLKTKIGDLRFTTNMPGAEPQEHPGPADPQSSRPEGGRIIEGTFTREDDGKPRQ